MLEPNPCLYMGTKVILALRMTRQVYNDYRGWTLSADEDGSDAGYLVEYVDGGPRNDERHIGYISWSPKGVFDGHYHSATKGMSFGHALEAVKRGYRVARKGWNGKGMWLTLQVPDAHSKMTLPYVYLNYPTTSEFTPGARVPWLASQTDMLADDWVLIPSV